MRMQNLSYLSSPNPNPFKYKSIVDVVIEKANENPDKEIVVERIRGGYRKSLTYRQLKAKSEKIAYYLVANGIGVGDSVAIMGPNSLEWIIGEFAILMTGAVAVHIRRTTETFSETQKILSSSHCRASLVDPDENVQFLSELNAHMKRLEFKGKNPIVLLLKTPQGTCKLPSIGGVLSDQNEGKHFNASLPSINPESPAIIFTTSGSTDAPKMVEYTHLALSNASFASFSSLNGAYKIGGKSYNDRPFTWFGGTPIFNIMVGNPRVFADIRLSLNYGNILEIWEFIVSEKSTNAFFLPYTLMNLMENKDDIIKYGYKLYGILTGGQIIQNCLTEVIGLFCEKFSICYGSTEMGVVSSAELKFGMEVRNVGRLLAGYEVKIVCDKDKTLDRGNVGEIFVRSPFTMKGYRNAPNLNKGSFADGGWFRSGDLGDITADDMLRVKGKANNVIKRGGMKILSNEVESIIAEIHGVKEVIVIAVPDIYLLEEVCACVVLERGTSTGEREMRSICNEKLGDNILGNSPSFYLIFEAFPRLPNGKVNKIQIKQRATDMLQLSCVASG